MFRHWTPKQSILPLLIGEEFPDSIAVAGIFLEMLTDVGLFFDPYWGDSLQCWASFEDERTVAKGHIWSVLCVYTKPEDVHWNKNVDIRFYTSLERRLNQGYQLTDDDITWVQENLRIWATSYVDEFKHILPENFYFLFGSIHTALEQALRSAFNIPQITPFQPWLKFLISSNTIPTIKSLPDHVEIDRIYPQHFDLILSSSSIPRTRQYLQTRIPSSTALYLNSKRDRPLAFCVTAPDQSLSTLWVDPAFRSRGLGKKVARERLLGPNGMIQCRNFDFDHTLGMGWSHADIAADNSGSRRICEWLGGKEAWKVVWIRIEMNPVRGSEKFIKMGCMVNDKKA
jgi:hypothetical protein